MHEIQLRLVEFAFWFLLNDLYKYKSDLNWIYDLIDLVAAKNTFSSLSVKAAATQLMNDSTLKPYKLELVAVLYLAEWPISIIKQKAKLNGKNIYAAIDEYKHDPFPAKLWFDEHTVGEIKKFLLRYEELTNTGGYLSYGLEVNTMD